MGLRGVVDVCVMDISDQFVCATELSHTGWSGALAQEADHGLAASLEDLGCVHCGMDDTRLVEAEVVVIVE